MKKLVIIFILALAVISNLNAELTFQLDFASRYIWRGFDVFSPDKPAIQSSITWDVVNSGFSINVWGSFALADRDRLDSVNGKNEIWFGISIIL